MTTSHDGAIVVTGADGFVGRALCAALVARRVEVRAISRATHGDLARAAVADLADACAGARALIHLAGRAHVLDERAADAPALYHAANVVATQNVARAALQAGVEALVFASSIKVNGEATLPGRPFTAADVPRPQDAYGRSKLAAEDALRGLAASSTMRAVALRLPLVYGPGVKGNFSALWDAVAAGRWLPLGSIDNRRTLLGLSNLVDALIAGTGAPSGTYLVGDPTSVSTPGLVRAIALAQGTVARLGSVPVALLRLAGTLGGRGAPMRRLTSSLEVDSQAFIDATGWSARRTLADELAAMQHR